MYKHSIRDEVCVCLRIYLLEMHVIRVYLDSEIYIKRLIIIAPDSVQTPVRGLKVNECLVAAPS